MTSNVECVAPDTGVRELAIKMKTLDVGFIPVCEKDRLSGTVTDRDIVIRAIAEGKAIDSCKARDHSEFNDFTSSPSAARPQNPMSNWRELLPRRPGGRMRGPVE